MSLFNSIHKQIDQWQARGLLESEVAERLRDDVQQNKGGFGLGSVLAILGAVLLGAAVIMFVAANWQEIPRIIRVLLILLLIWGGYIGGVWRQRQGDTVFAPALYLLGAISYGAGIALIGQMYHMSGDILTAALAWAVGVFVAAFLLRSSILTIAAVAICGFYLFSALYEASSRLDIGSHHLLITPLLIVLGSLAAFYTHAVKAVHLLAWLVLAYCVIYYADTNMPWILSVMIAVGIVFVGLQGSSKAYVECAGNLGSQLAGYGVLAILIGLAVYQVEGISYRFDDTVVYSILGLAVSIGALMWAGSKSPHVRVFAYLGFSAHVMYLAFTTVGTMIGTSGFFLTAGILVMLLASFVTRMEKRMRASAQNKAGADQTRQVR